MKVNYVSKLLLLAIIIVTGITFNGCTFMSRGSGWNVASTKTFEMGSKYVKLGTYEDEDMAWWILIFPLGEPKLDAAVDKCISKGGGDLATNVVFYGKNTTYFLATKYGVVCRAEVWKKASMGDLRDNKELFELKENQNGVKELVSTKDNNTKYAVIDNSKDLHSQVTFQ